MKNIKRTTSLVVVIIALATLNARAQAEPLPEQNGIATVQPRCVAQAPEGKIGEIVQPATGAGRAIYAPLDQAVIPPCFHGRWAARPGQCVGQTYTDRMELRRDLAILAGRSLTIQVTLVEDGPRSTADRALPRRAGDHVDATDILVGFGHPGDGNPRYIHFYFAREGGPLIVEEVGKPRRGYVRCV